MTSNRGWPWVAVGVAALFAAACSKQGSIFECQDCQCTAGEWESLEPPGAAIPAGFLNAMVTTPDGVLMFMLRGGTAGDEPMGVWSWDGSTWTDRTTGSLVDETAPEDIWPVAASYHPEAGHSIIAGDFGGDAPDFTWVFSDFTWQKVLSSPTPSYSTPNTKVAYNGGEGLVILFGGVGIGFETWGWDGSVWNEIDLLTPSDAQPAARIAHALAYHEASQSTLMFGGQVETPEGTDTVGDTWIYRERTWTFLNVAGPAARRGHSLTYDPELEQTVLFGGENEAGQTLNDVWLWDGAIWTPAFVPGDEKPAPRLFHMAAYDAVNDGVLVVGGMGVGDMWLFRTVEKDAAIGGCCGDGICQFPERDSKSPENACPTDCAP